MDKLQHMLVMNMLFLVNATLENDTNTQIKRLVVHAYSLEKLVMLLLIISLTRILVITILYWTWFRYIGLDTTTSKEVLRVMTYTRQMCLTCVWSSVTRSTYYQSHLQFLLLPCNNIALHIINVITHIILLLDCKFLMQALEWGWCLGLERRVAIRVPWEGKNTGGVCPVNFNLNPCTLYISENH